MKGGPDGGTGRIVEVSRFRTLVFDTGREDLPFELDSSDLKALIKDDAGQRVVYPEVTGAGAATFREIPFGPYVLGINGYNVATDEDRIDLGIASLGRATSSLTDGGTVLSLDVTGLMPWQQYSDVLQLTSENAGYVAVNAQSYALQPDGGATAATLDFNYWAACSTQRGQLAPLIDADAGDRAVLTQLVNATVPDAGALELRTLVRSAALPAFSMADHAITPVAAALGVPPAQLHVSLDYRQSQFEALRAAVSPLAVANSSSVTVTALPYTAELGAYTPAPDLAVLRPQQLTADVALDFDTGNPFPPSWPKLLTVRYAMQIDVQFPDGGSRVITSAVTVQDVLPPSGAAVLTPRVSPPRDLRLDGAAGDSRAQIARTPTLTWQPPLVGSPTSYGVTVYHLSRVGSGPVIALAEDVFYETTERTLKLPFGDLRPAGEYVFAVTAFDSPNAHVAKAPFKGGFPFGAAMALTALMRVDPTPQP